MLILLDRRARRWRYLLRDRFTTAQAAPLASPRTCEPGPGTLTIQDTANHLSVSGGKLVADGDGVGWGNPGFLYTSGVARAAGLALLCDFEETAGVSLNSVLGFNRINTFGGYDDLVGGGFGRSGLAPYVMAASAPVTGISMALSPAVVSLTEQALVLRAVGWFHLAKMDGVWNLVWVGNTGNQATLYPMFTHSIAGKGKSLDNFRIVQLSRFDADAKVYTNRLVNPIAGATTTHTPDLLLDVTFTYVDATPLRVDYRYTDANNRWTLFGSAGHLQIYEAVGGVVTNRGDSNGVLANGNGYRVVVTAAGNVHKVYLNNALKFTYTDPNNLFLSITGLSVNAVSGGVAEVVCWPRHLALPGGV